MAEQINLVDILSELRKTSYNSTIKNNLVETILEGKPVYTFISEWNRFTVASVIEEDDQDPFLAFIAANETMRIIGYVRICIQTENNTVLFSVDHTCDDISQIIPSFAHGLEIIKSAMEAFKNNMNTLAI